MRQTFALALCLCACSAQTPPETFVHKVQSQCRVLLPTQEIVSPTGKDPKLFIEKNLALLFWVENDGIYVSRRDTSGEIFTRPTRIAPKPLRWTLSSYRDEVLLLTQDQERLSSLITKTPNGDWKTTPLALPQELQNFSVASQSRRIAITYQIEQNLFFQWFDACLLDDCTPATGYLPLGIGSNPSLLPFQSDSFLVAYETPEGEQKITRLPKGEAVAESLVLEKSDSPLFWQPILAKTRLVFARKQEQYSLLLTQDAQKFPLLGIETEQKEALQGDLLAAVQQDDTLYTVTQKEDLLFTAQQGTQTNAVSILPGEKVLQLSMRSYGTNAALFVAYDKKGLGFLRVTCTSAP